VEAGFFEGKEELAQKVSHFLQNEADRIGIAHSGHLRALRDHSLDKRAQVVLHTISEQFTKN
jgi:hypothetical protein